MRAQRLLTVLAAIVLLGGSLVACGDSDGQTAEPASEATVTLYFSRDSDECDEVEAVTRTIERDYTLELVLTELVAGPTESERQDGFGSWFSSDTAGMLESIDVDDGVALVSFDPALRQAIPNASTSCGSANLLAQLDTTIEGFPDVERAIYSLGGDVDAFYEWLQLESPAR